MEYFFTPEAFLPPGLGFSHFGGAHLVWLAVALALGAALCAAYCRSGPRARRGLRVGVGCTIFLCELLKDGNLLLQGALSVDLLPLHLCGLAVFFCLYHCLRPGQTVGNFLYSTCAPGAAFALLFPDWTVFPPFSYASIVAFTVHTLIAVYPLMQMLGGDLRPDWKLLGRCGLLLLALAGAVGAFNLVFDTNYMFLRAPAPASPLEWFAAWLGTSGYLLGYIPMIAAVWAALYLPFRRK